MLRALQKVNVFLLFPLLFMLWVINEWTLCNNQCKYMPLLSKQFMILNYSHCIIISWVCRDLCIFLHNNFKTEIWFALNFWHYETLQSSLPSSCWEWHLLPPFVLSQCLLLFSELANNANLLCEENLENKITFIWSAIYCVK